MKSIYDIQGNLLMQVPVTPECEHVEELMRADEVRMYWNAADNAVIPDGAYVEVPDGGEKYYLLEPYKPVQKKENHWRYEPVFVSAFYGLSKVPFYMYTYEDSEIVSREADWVLTDTPYNFMDTLCKAIKNETGLDYDFAVAQDLPASKTVSFSSIDIISALNAIANAFETEFWLEKYTTPQSGKIGRIHLSLANDGATAKVLTVGTNINVPSVSDGSEGFYNRFVVLGSTRNITQDYQGANVNSVANKRLTLDPTDYPDGYIDYSNGGKPYTKILTFDDIYPASNLRIKSGSILARIRYVLDDDTKEPITDSTYAIYYFQLEKYEGGSWSDYVFDNEDYPDGDRLPGKQLSIHFQTGALRGREFELEYHETALTNIQDKADALPFSCPANCFEIVKTQEGTYVIPALTGLVPSNNDEVILFNIAMPDTYIAGAQERLETAAFEEINRRYLQLNADGTAKTDTSGNLLRVDLNSYQFSSNPVAFGTSNPGLKIASNVTYVNGTYSLSTRVKSLVTKLDFPIRQTITIGQELTKGVIQQLKDEAASANENIDLLDALNASTKTLLDAYNRTQEFIQAGLVDNYFEIGTPATLIQLKSAYSYLGPKKGLIFDSVLENDTSDADLYVKWVGEGTNRQRVLYSPLALITEGDQIVGSGTPGGGGGGAVYLYELGDVYHDTDKTKVLRTDGTTPAAVGDVLQLTSLTGGNKWAAVPASSIGRIYTGGTGITIGNDNTISVTANTYAPYNSAGYLPLTGGVLSLSAVNSLQIKKVSNSSSMIYFTGLVDNSDTPLGYLGFSGANNPVFRNTSDSYYTIYHEGNANLNTVDWAAKTISAAGNITITTSSASGLSIIRTNVSSSRIESDPYGMYFSSTIGNNQTHMYLRAGYGVGIGKAPTCALDVSGRANCMYVSFYTTSDTSAGYVGRAASSTNDFYVWNNSATPMYIGTNNATRMLINSSGNITMGSSDLASTSYKLYVNGGTYLNSAAYINGQVTSYGGYITYSSGNTYLVCVNHTGNIGRVYNIKDDASAYGDLWVNALMYFDATNSRVGVDTTTPGGKLDVNGLTMTTGIKSYGGVNVFDSRSSTTYRLTLDSDGSVGHLFNYKDSDGTFGNLALNYGGGNVGIGTDDPGSYKLYVNGTLLATTSVRSQAFYLTKPDNTIIFDILPQASASGTGTANDMWIYSRNVSTARLVLYSAWTHIQSKCRIGAYSTATAPTDALDIEGGITLSGSVSITNSAWQTFSITRTNVGVASMGIDRNGLYIYNSLVSAGASSYMYLQGGWGLKITGALQTTGDQVISSDINLKENLQPVTYTIEDIAKCRAVTFDWKDGRGKSAGSIAQDWKPLIPELVHGEEGNMTLAYGQIALVNTILLAKHETEQDKEIKKLKNRVKELEDEVKRLRLN